ncbi:hypothetical protein UA08_09015 [Talaromyces atroroseus]|uniref:Phytocyanin domain-containing protein n=1 Tax=Talaromyces atroroseus TaxID=1441469 RepID=A0A1Q5Q7C8_TALAT|nr:hypothetical protein UA08_09015 [Talaromyces atroroseus]OKL55754.1 hypothetical protein UA08_09015 [Talaromyces atroroseus]
MLRLMTSSLFLLSSLLISLTQAQCNSTRTASTTSPTPSSLTIDVQVGLNGLTFSPPILTAAQGSTINFHFDPRNHSVAESRFASPCQYVDGGIWSGYVPTSRGVAPNIFSITLNDSNAHWLYCSQGSHCQAGMVMVINPPANSPDTLRAYTLAAHNTTQSTDGNVVSGGVIVGNSSSSSSSSSTASTSSASSSTASSLSSSSSSTGATSTSTSLAVGNAPSGWLGVAVLGVMWVVSRL